MFKNNFKIFHFNPFTLFLKNVSHKNNNIMDVIFSANKKSQKSKETLSNTGVTFSISL